LAVVLGFCQPHADPAASAAYLELCTVNIPAPKAQHADMYRTWAGANRLRRPAGRKLTRNTNQITNWNRDIAVDEEKVRTKLQARNITPPAAPGAKVALSINGRERIERTLPELTSLVKIPTWDRAGSPRRFQVDHKVEYQVASGDGAVDTLENYELFDPFLNQSSGGGLMVAIRQKVQRYLCTIEPYKSRTGDPKASWADAGDWLAGHAICFTEVHGGGGTRGVAVGGWSKEDIEAVKPLDQATEVPDPAKGKADEFVLASGPGGFQLARIHHESGQSAFAVPQGAATAIAGLRLGQVSLNGAEGSAAAGAAIGSVQASWNLPEAWQPANPDISLNLKSSGEYLGYPDQVPPLNLDFRGLSPVGFDTVRVQDGKLYAQGQLHPSLNLFGAPLMVTLDGSDLSFSLTYSAGEISLPVPGVTVDDASVSLLYSTERGLGASGSVFFSVPRLGGGSLNAAVTQAGGFEASGNFDFDSSLFDRARIQVWYREGAFGGQGEIGIDQPNRIRGIRSAALTVGFEEQGFHADGTVQPQMPGVQQAGLRMAYSEADGLTVGGNLQLAEAPGIRSGSVDVTVQKRDGDWKVAATGTAQPAIPGIDSQLDVGYDDGAFTAEASGAFQRGMLSGQATVGVTNRSVGEDGRPSGEAAPDAPLIVYGGGSATLQIAPWLQGTAGIRLSPAGEVTVSGEIALPSQLEVFPRKEINKQLLAVSTQIPIVPGVVAEVGGNLGATAGIGPGALDQLRIGIEYNPSHEEDTHVTGEAHLAVPADAGLRLGARAGIGLGITGASATGGIELGGSLGIAGAAEAGVHIDWMPSQGLQIDAEADFHAEPRFRFDVSGYVSVKAIGVEIYDNRWELAAYELGSNLRFGVRFPIRYRQGQPFDVSLDDVEFEVPEVDPGAMVRQLGERIF
ncbi:MAG: hypothetical protein HGA47_11105, partial [Zoogloea sp.]|nr:hypothetical protein [Zoogloea sp.]